MARGKYKHRKRLPDPPRAPSEGSTSPEERLARLREELRPELERIQAASRRSALPSLPALSSEWRPGLGDRLRFWWRKQRNQLALRLAFRRMRQRMLAPPQALDTGRRFKTALERYLRHMDGLEKWLAEDRLRALTRAELLLDDLRHEVEEARVAADRWEDWARQAVLTGRDDLAREALKLRDEWQRQADEWQSRLERARARFDHTSIVT